MRFARIFLAMSICLALASLTRAQVGNSGTIQGTVTDPSGAVLPKATVTINNAVSGLQRSTNTDNSGSFVFTNIPYNPYPPNRLPWRRREIWLKMTRQRTRISTANYSIRFR
jgi:hypothetical protein